VQVCACLGYGTADGRATASDTKAFPVRPCVPPTCHLPGAAAVFGIETALDRAGPGPAGASLSPPRFVRRPEETGARPQPIFRRHTSGSKYLASHMFAVTLIMCPAT